MTIKSFKKSTSHLVASVPALILTALVGCALNKGTDAALKTGTAVAATPLVGSNAVALSMSTNTAMPVNARTLFLHNCAHCHGADARGDEGPDLHGLDFTDKWITNRILNGKAGQMTAFKGKLKDEEIGALVAYVKGLK